ncbi:hypothetical protein [Afipia broomeae]|uniref:hypothetical protein n=1 Tax=Afipia broomeae TaxID=56946 RepID=UPI0005A1F6CC|nr:hypothetical protein [Afipia broomeae]
MNAGFGARMMHDVKPFASREAMMRSSRDRLAFAALIRAWHDPRTERKGALMPRLWPKCALRRSKSQLTLG